MYARKMRRKREVRMKKAKKNEDDIEGTQECEEA